jgi:hypothetical protein
MAEEQAVPLCPACGDPVITSGCYPADGVCGNPDDAASYARLVVTGGVFTAYNARQAAGDARAAARGPVTYEIDDVPPNAGPAS